MTSLNILYLAIARLADTHSVISETPQYYKFDTICTCRKLVSSNNF